MIPELQWKLSKDEYEKKLTKVAEQNEKTMASVRTINALSLEGLDLCVAEKERCVAEKNTKRKDDFQRRHQNFMSELKAFQYFKKPMKPQPLSVTLQFHRQPAISLSPHIYIYI